MKLKSKEGILSGYIIRRGHKSKLTIAPKEKKTRPKMIQDQEDDLIIAIQTVRGIKM